MPFPEAERIHYKRNPLQEVVCQLRFPAILRIETEKPAIFQEHIRKQYPIFQENPPPNIIQPLNSLSQNLSQHLRFNLNIRQPSSLYHFISTDEIWQVSLTREFMALSSRQYTSWEAFISHLQEPLNAVIKYYEPPFFTRIGLRYVNVIQRSALGLNSVEWFELLQPHIGSELSAQCIANDIEQSQCQAIIRLNEYNSRVQMRHGLAALVGNNEQCYLIDNDFYIKDRTETHDVKPILDYFHRQAGQIFRWCITDRLHRAMEP